jgi:hypothetical protein
MALAEMSTSAAAEISTAHRDLAQPDVAGVSQEGILAATRPLHAQSHLSANEPRVKHFTKPPR